MSVDFFTNTCQETPTTELSFGICDDQNNTRAYLDFTISSKLVAEIENPNLQSIVFTAIDYCIDLLRPDGTRDNHCDGMLTYSDSIVFVELKERKGKAGTWIPHGEKQLRAVISHFENNHDINIYSSKRAFLSNNKKPFAHSFQGNRIRRFKLDTGIDLFIMNKIII